MVTTFSLEWLAFASVQGVQNIKTFFSLFHPFSWLLLPFPPQGVREAGGGAAAAEGVQGPGGIAGGSQETHAGGRTWNKL